MAITSKLTRRVELPHEPGEWIEVRMPSLRILHGAQDEDQYKGMMCMLSACITGWSYDEPVTEDNVWELDPKTAGVVLGELNVTATEVEEKNS